VCRSVHQHSLEVDPGRPTERLAEGGVRPVRMDGLAPGLILPALSEEGSVARVGHLDRPTHRTARERVRINPRADTPHQGMAKWAICQSGSQKGREERGKEGVSPSAVVRRLKQQGNGAQSVRTGPKTCTIASGDLVRFMQRKGVSDGEQQHPVGQLRPRRRRLPFAHGSP
jgi:hypothetical protein